MKLRFLLALLLPALLACTPAAIPDTQTDRIAGISGHLAVKAPVVASTTANITLSGTQTIDGVAVVANDRVLVKNQTTGSENGVYEVSTTAWARSKDFNGARDVITGTLVWDPNRAAFYELTTASPITIGTTSLAFSQQLPFNSFPGDIVFATDYGATTAGTAAANTTAIQVAIDAFGDLTGGTIYIELGISFNLQDLVWNNNAELVYSANSEADSPSTDGQATYEEVHFRNYKNAAGDVNEYQWAAPLHPAHILDIREDIPNRGAGSQSGLGSYLIRFINQNQWQFGRREAGEWTLVSYDAVFTLAVGTDNFSSNPSVADTIAGDTSGASGVIVTIGTTSMTVSLRDGSTGIFTDGETVTANAITSDIVLAGTTRAYNTRRKIVANNYGLGAGANLPAANAIHAWDVGGILGIEDASGGIYGAAKTGLRLFDDLASPTIGVRWALNTSDDTMEWIDDQGVTLATMSMTTGIFTPTGVETSTTAALDAVGNAINTAGKYEGKQLFNTDTDNPVWAVGSAAADIWVDGAGTTVHSPS